MEATKIGEQLKYVSKAGVTLNTEERMQLEYALSTLQSSMNFESLFLWGKVEGKSRQMRNLSQQYMATCSFMGPCVTAHA